jgi:UDP-glucose 4-epimerase
MRILIVGNMGYVGPAVVAHLRQQRPDAVLHGYDTGYFAHCLTASGRLPESHLDAQFFGDARRIGPGSLVGYDAVVQLSAISNDPMGARFARVTHEINHASSVAIARMAADAGVKNFVFASSCSVYGVASGPPRREQDPLNPVTDYAKSKIATEIDLKAFSTDMVISSLRFATACGMSERLRLDLVLNDFVAGALSKGEITVLSDGTPWRPLIDVRDMARAVDWAIDRPAANGGRYLAVNVGSDDRNYQVRDLAEAVGRIIPGTSVSINTAAPADSRSYKVDFGLWRSLAPDHQPVVTLDESIRGLKEGLESMGFRDAEFRTSTHMRLKVLESHIASGRITEELYWTT